MKNLPKRHEIFLPKRHAPPKRGVWNQFVENQFVESNL